jgi:hypothetical protein
MQNFNSDTEKHAYEQARAEWFATTEARNIEVRLPKTFWKYLEKVSEQTNVNLHEYISHASFEYLQLVLRATNAVDIFCIVPYKHEDIWVFDDESRGLQREPLTAGTDTILNTLTASIPDADKGVVVVFSARYFPNAMEFTLIEAINGGHTYFSSQLNMVGWLCPALLRYFAVAPAKLYVKVG